jgi:hypothetical protein
MVHALKMCLCAHRSPNTTEFTDTEHKDIQQIKLRGPSPQAKYPDRATTACQHR